MNIRTKSNLPTLLTWATAALIGAGNGLALAAGNSPSQFIGLDDFSNFTRSQSTNATAGVETVLLSPVIQSALDWNELIVSWNTEAPPGTFVKVEASAVLPTHKTTFYTLGLWSPDNTLFPRTSVHGQLDNDGKVDTDTLILKNLSHAVQIRITLGGTNTIPEKLKFIGLSFCNTHAPLPELAPNQAAWGMIIPTPERSQNNYPQEKGWCSATSVSMDLARWAEILHRPEMNLDVPEVADKVLDQAFGTGNWPFNTAFAGSFPGMRSYVSRFDGMTELEDWVTNGIPVVISARWNLLKPGRKDTGNGHLIVCIGFTKDGDVVINDPATHMDRGESVRHIYKRADVIKSWETSHNTVYLIYPVGAKLPEDRYGHW
ncbi:MAG TPA: C39 family peptidase [Verrucomicrobiae bacterium]|jgi:hypothetical protein